MADNTTLPGGDVIRDKDRSGVKTQIVTLDLTPSGAETLINGTVPVSGTVDTELPAAAALSDAIANPTVPGVGAHTMAWNEAAGQWRRLRSYIEGDVDSTLEGVILLWEDAGNAVTPASATKPMPVSTVPSAYGTDSVEAMVGVRTTGGATLFSAIGAASDNATVVKASAGNLYALQLFNIASTPVWFKLYNKATSPTNGDTPVKRLIIPGNTAGAGVVYVFDGGLSFATGISYRCVTGIADNDNTSASANQQTYNGDYK